jgi:hypothetical protein
MVVCLSAILLGTNVAAQTASSKSGSSPSASIGAYVYPKEKQSSKQQANDESQCYASARERTGFDPSAPPPAPAKAEQKKGGAAKGAAGGAAGGAAIGAIAGDAGTGAAIGATAGAVRGRRKQKQANQQAEADAQKQAQASQQQQLDGFRKAFSACMEARSYSVK